MKFGNILRVEHEENLIGRDFIIGDLHGSYHLLMKFMKLIGFNKEKDRIFSVGDLINRGVHSFKSLNLINEPWFFVVPGNHEGMFYSFIDPYQDGDWRQGNSFWSNGGNWINDYDVIDKKEELTELAKKLCDFPMVRTIKGKNKVHMIHAEFSYKIVKKYGTLTDSMIEDPIILQELCETPCWDGKSAHWGRDVFSPYYNITLSEKYMKDGMASLYESPDLSLVVSGHTIVKTPIKFGKLLNIDTGAWFCPRPLTIYDVKLNCLHQVNPDSEDLLSVDPFVVTS